MGKALLRSHLCVSISISSLPRLVAIYFFCLTKSDSLLEGEQGLTYDKEPDPVPCDRAKVAYEVAH